MAMLAISTQAYLLENLKEFMDVVENKLTPDNFIDPTLSIAGGVLFGAWVLKRRGIWGGEADVAIGRKLSTNLLQALNMPEVKRHYKELSKRLDNIGQRFGDAPTDGAGHLVGMQQGLVSTVFGLVTFVPLLYEINPDAFAIGIATCAAYGLLTTNLSYKFAKPLIPLGEKQDQYRADLRKIIDDTIKNYKRAANDAGNSTSTEYSIEKEINEYFIPTIKNEKDLIYAKQRLIVFKDIVDWPITKVIGLLAASSSIFYLEGVNTTSLSNALLFAGTMEGIMGRTAFIMNIMQSYADLKATLNRISQGSTAIEDIVLEDQEKGAISNIIPEGMLDHHEVQEILAGANEMFDLLEQDPRLKDNIGQLRNDRAKLKALIMKCGGIDEQTAPDQDAKVVGSNNVIILRDTANNRGGNAIQPEEPARIVPFTIASPHPRA